MTPLTLTKPSIGSTTPPLHPAELASRPLTFNLERRCTNKTVLAAVTDALCDKSSDDQLIATILTNAHDGGYQSELNAIISNSRARHNTDSFVINTNIEHLLAGKGFMLTQNSDGKVDISRKISSVPDPDRHQEISQSTARILPGELISLICSFDDEILVGEKNVVEIDRILRQGTRSEKGLLIAAASHQGKISYLNTLFLQMISGGHELDLSGVDLSNLNLRGIDLHGANLSGASMHGCNLDFANLRLTRLTKANLNGASLCNADLSNANLYSARLIAANLTNARMCDAILNSAVLKFANLTCADLSDDTDLRNAWLDHANLERTNLDEAYLCGASLTHARLHGVKLDWADLTDTNFSHAILIDTSMSCINWKHADFSHARLERIKLTAARSLQEAIWTDASFKKIQSNQPTMSNMPLRMWMHSNHK